MAFETEEGRKLVLAIEDNGIDILHRCGGNARCTTCRVEVLDGDPGEIREPERAILATKEDLDDHARLSCQDTRYGRLARQGGQSGERERHRRRSEAAEETTP